jgi:2-polyprenyl-3-methyl-5-hydroxy-6-metoxy-1,4-benzoquinol methylase
VLLVVYRALPGLLMRIFGPILRARGIQDSAFVDRLSVPYRRAVYGMGEAHWENKVERFGLVGCERVLDLGCGPGQWLPSLARQNAGVIGVDVDATLLEVARETAAPRHRVMLVQSRAESLCFRGATFDAVLCYGVLMYTDYETTLREVSRVLKPGGRLIIGLMGLGYYLKHVADGLRHNRAEAVRYGIEPIATTFGQALLGRQPQGTTFWTARAISRILARRGFDVVRVRGDRYDPLWPTSYAGAHFHFCVEALKKS